jgi:hypothetical protein
MKLIAIAVIGLCAVNALTLSIIKKQNKRIDELEAKQRIDEAFDEAEAE